MESPEQEREPGPEASAGTLPGEIMFEDEEREASGTSAAARPVPVAEAASGRDGGEDKTSGPEGKPGAKRPRMPKVAKLFKRKLSSDPPEAPRGASPTRGGRISRQATGAEDEDTDDAPGNRALALSRTLHAFIARIASKGTKAGSKHSTIPGFDATARLYQKFKDDRRLQMPNIRLLSQYRDKSWLVVGAGLAIFMVAIILYSQLSPKPDRFLCTREDCYCTTLQSDALNQACPEIGTFAEHPTPLLAVSYFYIKPEKQDNPLCYAVPDSEITQEVKFVDYQPVYEDFNALQNCTVEESLYHVLMESNAFLWYIYVTVVVIASGVVLLLLSYTYPTWVIPATHAIAAAVLWAAFVASLALLSGWAVIWLFFGFCQLIYFVLIKQKLPDLQMAMIVSTKLTKRNWGIPVIGCVSAFAQAIFFIIWGYVWVTINGRLTWAIDLLWFISFFWTSQIIKYTAHTVIAGSTGSWYFGKAFRMPTLRSAIRATTTSLGSIIYASTFMFFFKAILVISSYLRIAGGIIAAISGGCLICFEFVMKSHNIYGLVFVAVYGNGFALASSKAYTMMIESSVKGMMLDDVIAATVVVGGIGMGALAVAACWVALRTGLATGYSGYDFTTTLYVPSFLLGLLTGLLIMEIAEPIIVTIYTCFAEEPRVLEITDRKLYNDMKEQWYAGLEDSDEDSDMEDESDDGLSISTGLSEELEEDFDPDYVQQPAIAIQIAQEKWKTQQPADVPPWNEQYLP